MAFVSDARILLSLQLCSWYALLILSSDEKYRSSLQSISVRSAVSIVAYSDQAHASVPGNHGSSARRDGRRVWRRYVCVIELNTFGSHVASEERLSNESERTSLVSHTPPTTRPTVGQAKRNEWSTFGWFRRIFFQNNHRASYQPIQSEPE